MMSSKVVSPEDVLESLMNDGTFDSIRTKMINQLKTNEELKKSTIGMLEQSKVLSTPGAEKQTKRELFEALRAELETQALEKASKAVWDLILDNNGLGKEITETVEKVFCRLSGLELPAVPSPPPQYILPPPPPLQQPLQTQQPVPPQTQQPQQQPVPPQMQQPLQQQPLQPQMPQLLQQQPPPLPLQFQQQQQQVPPSLQHIPPQQQQLPLPLSLQHLPPKQPPVVPQLQHLPPQQPSGLLPPSLQQLLQQQQLPVLPQMQQLPLPHLQQQPLQEQLPQPPLLQQEQSPPPPPPPPQEQPPPPPPSPPPPPPPPPPSADVQTENDKESIEREEDEKIKDIKMTESSPRKRPFSELDVQGAEEAGYGSANISTVVSTGSVMPSMNPN